MFSEKEKRIKIISNIFHSAISNNDKNTIKNLLDNQENSNLFRELILRNSSSIKINSPSINSAEQQIIFIFPRFVSTGLIRLVATKTDNREILELCIEACIPLIELPHEKKHVKTFYAYLLINAISIQNKTIVDICLDKFPNLLFINIVETFYEPILVSADTHVDETCKGFSLLEFAIIRRKYEMILCFIKKRAPLSAKTAVELSKILTEIEKELVNIDESINNITKENLLKKEFIPSNKLANAALALEAIKILQEKRSILEKALESIRKLIELSKEKSPPAALVMPSAPLFIQNVDETNTGAKTKIRSIKQKALKNNRITPEVFQAKLNKAIQNKEHPGILYDSLFALIQIETTKLLNQSIEQYMALVDSCLSKAQCNGLFERAAECKNEVLLTHLRPYVDPSIIQDHIAIAQLFAQQALETAIVNDTPIPLDTRTYFFKCLTPLQKGALLAKAIAKPHANIVDWLIQHQASWTDISPPKHEQLFMIATFDEESGRIQRWLEFIGIQVDPALQAAYRDYLKQKSATVKQLHYTILKRIGISLEASKSTQKSKLKRIKRSSTAKTEVPLESVTLIDHKPTVTWRQAIQYDRMDLLYAMINDASIDFTERLDEEKAYTILHWAVIQKNLKLIEKLLSDKIHFEALFELCDYKGNTALLLAQQHDGDIVFGLLYQVVRHQALESLKNNWSSVAPVLSDIQKQSLLQTALQTTHSAMIEWFMCQPELLNSHKIQALNKLLQNQSLNAQQICSVLEQIKAKQPELLDEEQTHIFAYTAVTANRSEIVRYFIQQYPDILIKSNQDNLILLEVVSECNPDLKIDLLKRSLNYLLDGQYGLETVTTLIAREVITQTMPLLSIAQREKLLQKAINTDCQPIVQLIQNSLKKDSIAAPHQASLENSLRENPKHHRPKAGESYSVSISTLMKPTRKKPGKDTEIMDLPIQSKNTK